MSPSDEPPEAEVVFFVDRSLGAVLVPEALRAAGYRVEVHDDHFDQATQDIAWLPEVGARGWVVLTKDRRIRSRTGELVAMLRAGVHVFVLREKKLNGEDQARAFLSAARGIIEIVRKHPPPLVATVTAAGGIVEIEDADRLRGRLAKEG